MSVNTNYMITINKYKQRKKNKPWYVSVLHPITKMLKVQERIKK